MTFSITLPNRNGDGSNETIDSTGHLVLIGANGAGKTRLGIAIEASNQYKYIIHRVTAQKALTIPDYVQSKNAEEAEKELLWGRSDAMATVERKLSFRWNNAPTTHVPNDYDKLLSLLFAKEAERDRQHSDETRKTQRYVPVPDSPIDSIKKIWGDIMPHRVIKFQDGKILVKKSDDPEYHGKEMSDGERVALYLIATCLCAPLGSVIIVDEPEIHLHKSLVDKLWNNVEELCQGKKLIYITHDLAFAASRTDALKLWVKSYGGNNSWTWSEVPNDEHLPESMVLEVIGSRKKIMFCEGEPGSLDLAVYQLVYPDYHVIARGSCSKVIDSTKALRTNASLHHLDAVGVIDNDYRVAEEIGILQSHAVYTIGVAEIENLCCVESVIRIVAEHLEHDPDDITRRVTSYVTSALSEEMQLQISSMAERRIEYLLGAFSKTSSDKNGLITGLNNTVSRIDVEKIYAECEARFATALASKNLDALMCVYNRKSLLTRISRCFALGTGEYQKLLLRLIKGPKRQRIVDALKRHMPSLS